MADVVLTDRHPTIDGASESRGSIVELITQGAVRDRTDPVLWISPSPGAGALPSRNEATVRIKRFSVDPTDHRLYYFSVGAARIWPALHGLPCRLPDDAVSDSAWDAFARVNRMAAQTVASEAPSGARVTVHDYLLALAVPEIRRLRPDVRLAYVHHTPWPRRDGMDVARLALLRELLRAADRADIVCVSARPWAANLAGWGPIRARVVHPGVDVGMLRRRAGAGKRALGSWARRLAEGLIERPIVAAVGRADPSKNADTLLNAWTALVRGGARGTLCLHQIPTSRTAVPLYRTYAQAVRDGVEAANRARAGSVVVCEREDREDALCLLERADTVAVCSRADGWNLVAHEAAILGPDRQDLVLSSTVGATDVLAPIGRLVRNPESVAEVAAAVGISLGAHRYLRMRVARSHLALPTPSEWWSGILAAVEDAQRRGQRNHIEKASPP